MSGSVTPPSSSVNQQKAVANLNICSDSFWILVLRYESATDGGLSLQGQWEGVFPLTQPLHTQWTGPEHTPYPHTLPPTPRDQALGEAEAEGEGEGDSGFQEAGVCPRPKLGSPQRASEALMLAPGHQLVPMVGPQHGPVDVHLSSSYMDKARQASE